MIFRVAIVVPSVIKKCCVCGDGIYTNRFTYILHSSVAHGDLYVCTNCFPFGTSNLYSILILNNNLQHYVSMYNEVFADTIPIDEFLRLVKIGQIEV